MSPGADHRLAAFSASGTGLPQPLAYLLPLPVLIGLVLLYLPIYNHLAQTLWPREEYSHGPLIALAAFFLLWRQREALAQLPPPSHLWPGSLALASGQMFAWLGQTQDIPLLAMASQPLVLGAIIHLLHGRAGLRRAAFPLLFLLFMVPLPGVVIDSLTLELKAWISAAAVQLLHLAGYPVARSGVIIVIGQYQMLIADACSGLHSLFSLSALGVLFIHLWPATRRAHQLLMLLAILPIAVIANFVRTLALVLLTYHAGDAVARDWHSATGIMLFLVALALLMGLSTLLNPTEQRRPA